MVHPRAFSLFLALGHFDWPIIFLKSETLGSPFLIFPLCWLNIQFVLFLNKKITIKRPHWRYQCRCWLTLSRLCIVGGYGLALGLVPGKWSRVYLVWIWNLNPIALPTTSSRNVWSQHQATMEWEPELQSIGVFLFLRLVAFFFSFVMLAIIHKEI